ncbi:hypothetical protein [Streptomyces sp. SID5643]|uniref:hypothetical protein n=1 Tax=Streptomyces sp. SID5643 TaxID=2690307 RepID=UPI00136BC037|nr:hypothetical protein [Streptomyces sp. SID5643]MZF88210.1 hypothetical protein [Streptomyces sp. SID5643]
MDAQEDPDGRFVKAERLLQGLAMALMRLGVELDIRDADHNDWRPLVRQLYVLSSLGGHRFVSIAGEQGAGKTLLARNFYPEASSWLEDNTGLGEKCPVAIVEKAGLQEPRGVVVFGRSGVDAERTGQLVDLRYYSADQREEWRRHVKSQDARVLLTQLEVPLSFWQLEGTGFVLLPGLERGRAQEQWQELMKIVLATSPAVLLVADERRLANAGQPELLSLLRRGEDDLHMVVAVTRCEASASEVIEERIARAVEVFGTDPRDVVPVGKDGSSPKNWIATLRERLDAKRGSARDSRRLETRLMQELIRRDLAGVLRSAKAVRDRKILDSQTADQIQTLLDEFDQASDGLRRTLAPNVDERYGRHLDRASARLTKLLKDSGGFKEAGTRTLEFLRLRGNERDDRLTELVREAWLTSAESEHPGLPGPNAAYLECIEATVQIQRQIHSGAFTSSLTQGRLDRDVALVLTGRPPADAADAPSAEPQDAHVPTVRVSGQLVETVKALPFMTLDARAFAVGELAMPDGSLTTDKSPDELSHLLRDLADERKALLGTVGLLLGTDRFVTEDIDLVTNVGQLSAGLFAGGVKSAGASATVSTLLLTTLGVGVVSATLLKAGNNTMAERARLASLLLKRHKEVAEQQVLENVDELLRVTRDVLQARLQRALGADSELNSQFRLVSATRAVESYRERMLEALGFAELG